MTQKAEVNLRLDSAFSVNACFAPLNDRNNLLIAFKTIAVLLLFLWNSNETII